MKALLLVTELEDYSIAFANGLAKHMDVILAVPKRNYAALARWIDPAVDLRLLDWPRHRSLRNIGLIAGLLGLVRREKPDVIHLLSNNSIWLNLALPFWRGIPVVTTVHDVEVHPGDAETRSLPERATRMIVRQSDHIVVHGDGLRRIATAKFARPADTVHVLSHPSIRRYADQATADGLVRRAGGFSVLMFGRLYAYKGLQHLLQAEALIGDRIEDLRITIAGRGDDPAGLAHLMGNPACYDLHHRFIKDAEVAQLFLNADLIVLPYTEASQSGVLNVAAAFGKPVVVTDVGELGATVRTYGMGLVVPPNDPAQLADALVQMAQNPTTRARYADAAQAWANGVNAPEAVGAATLILYRRISAVGKSILPVNTEGEPG